MAGKSKLTEETLAALGAKKLAALAFAEAETNTAFRRRLSAAVAGGHGPDAVAAIVDRRLAALRRAHGFIDWDRVRDFAEDLQATLTIITDELGKADPDAAIDRVLHFLDTAEGVFDRVDDSNGRVQDVYYIAADAIPALAAGLSEKRKTSLPGRLHAYLISDPYGFCSNVLENLLPLLPATAVDVWDRRLAEDAGVIGAGGSKDDWQARAKFDRLVRFRQVVADLRGDADAYIALEQSRTGNMVNTLAIAERLLNAGRYGEALEWARKPARPDILLFNREGDAERSETPERVRLELRILEAKGDKAEAQQRRWDNFLKTLDGALLRDYVDRLGDFEEFEVLDRAFTHAVSFEDKIQALTFFVTWPKLDHAARLVVANAGKWDGGRYDALVPAAEALEESAPLAATILYRTLLDQILREARSKAYGHAARYYTRLDALADHIVPDGVHSTHATYKAELKKKHGRKTGFWSRIDGPTPKVI